jgi:hypothetical protein
MFVSHVYASLVQICTKHLSLLRWLFLAICITGIWWFNPEATVFLLDYVPTPLYVRDRAVVLSNPFIRVVHDALIYLFGHVWWSKIYLGSIFFLSLRLWYIRGKRLKSTFFNKEPLVSVQRLCLINMLIFVCNPFFSARYGTQPWIRLSVICLWFGLFELIRHQAYVKRKNVARIWVYRWIALMAMPHASFMIVVLIGTYFLFHFFNKKARLYTCILASIIFLLNINRILWSKTIDVVSSGKDFTEANIIEFSTHAHSWLWPIATAALWYWFRGEKYGSAFVPTSANSRRWLAGSIVLFFAFWWWYALASVWAKEKKISYQLLSLLVVSLVLWVGVSSDFLAPLTNRLYAHIPWYIWLREPQKRIGLYMMILLPLVVLWWGKSVPYSNRFIPVTRYALACCCLLIARTPGVFNAMKGRYIMSNYPSTYEQARTQLLLSSSVEPTHFIHLPRHSYHQCDWTNKVVANTLDRFFLPLNVITADNIEIWNLYTNSNNQRSKDIELFLQTKDITLLQQHGIWWILFTTTCADFKNYAWIETLPNTQKVIGNDDISIYTFK